MDAVRKRRIDAVAAELRRVPRTAPSVTAGVWEMTERGDRARTSGRTPPVPSRVKELPCPPPLN